MAQQLSWEELRDRVVKDVGEIPYREEILQAYDEAEKKYRALAPKLNTPDSFLVDIKKDKFEVHATIASSIARVMEVKGASLQTSFRALLVESGLLSIKPKVFELVMERPVAMWCSTPAEARKLYDAVDRLPQSYTLNHLAADHDVQVVIDQITPLESFARSVVFFALDRGRISALKIPVDDDESEHEVKVWNALEAEEGLNLVGPLRLLQIGRRDQDNFKKAIESKKSVDSKFKKPAEHKSIMVQDTVVLPRKGILMPMYACSTDMFREIATHREILSWSQSVFRALKYMHSKGWSHNDVKASNIFLDFKGNALLGDYGASQRFGEKVIQYTDAYWPTDLVPRAAAVNDYYLLVVTALDLCGGTTRNFTTAALLTLVQQQPKLDVGLREFLLSVLLSARASSCSS